MTYHEKQLAGAKRMPWGKYQGKTFLEIPVEYLRWCMTQPWVQEDVRDDIHDFLKFCE